MRPWHFVAWAQIQMEDKDWRALADRSLCGLALIIPRPKYTVVNSGLRPYKNTCWPKTPNSTANSLPPWAGVSSCCASAAATARKT